MAAPTATRPDLPEGFADHAARWARSAGFAGDIAIVRNAARLASQATIEGHVCSDLAALAATFDPPPSADRLRAQLLESRIVGTPAQPARKPLVLDDAGRLYLRRYYDDERRLAQALRARSMARPPSPRSPESVRARLDSLFPRDPGAVSTSSDRQRIGAALALCSRLTVISGGPGTGKTTSIVAVLACLLEQQPDLRIALAAPTGKAAARMRDALQARAAVLPAHLRAGLPEESFTIHRLLGVRADSSRFVHHAGNPLALDVLVVDEASMLDLALATRLTDALAAHTRLILLGDKDQLAAVEAGAVFAEISEDTTLTPDCVRVLSHLTGLPEADIAPHRAGETALPDCVVWLTESHRFARGSGIGELAQSINSGAGEAAVSLMRDCRDGALCWIDEQGNGIGAASLAHALAGYRDYLDALARPGIALEALFAAFERFRVLCAVRDSQRGTDALNEAIGSHVRRAVRRSLAWPALDDWYPGLAVMARRNDPVTRLFNGDIGICWPDESGEAAVHFRDSNGAVRPVPLLRLPAHDTAFAMTVHKSQGSEFESVLLVLPAHRSRVFTRELLYTAVTRASKTVAISGSADLFVEGCSRRTERRSGLLDRLRSRTDPTEGRNCGN